MKYATLFFLFCSAAFAADKKVSQLPAYGQGSWGSTDLFMIVDSTNALSKKTTVADFDARYLVSSSYDNSSVTLNGSSQLQVAACTGDVTSVAGSTSRTVALVGGSSAANVHAAELAANAATAANTASTIVKRDSSGNFSAGTITANLTGNASNLSGTPALPNGTTATTQTQGDNSTQLATTAYSDMKLPKTGGTLTGALEVDVATATSNALILKTTDNNVTDNIFETRNSSGVKQTYIDPAGALTAVLLKADTINSGSASPTTLTVSNRAFAAAGSAVTMSTGTHTLTSGQFNALALTPTYNESSGTAANTDLLINRTETAVGSGAQNFLDLQVGGTSKLKISNTGQLQVGGGTTLTSSQITMPSTVTHTGGLFDVDLNANYAQTGTSQTVTPFSLRPVYNQPSATSVSNSDLLINRTETSLGTTPGSQFLVNAQVGSSAKFTVSNTGGMQLAGSISPILSSSTLSLNTQGTSSANYTGTNIGSGTFTQTSGTQAIAKISPTYNQASGTAANTDLLINRTETAIGSGAQNLIDAQVGGTSKFRVSRTGNLTFAGHRTVNNGTIPTLSACGSSPTIQTGSTDSAGNFTIGSTGTGCVLTFATAFTNPPACFVSAQVSANLTSYTPATGTLTVVGAAGTYSYSCIGLGE